MPSLTINKINNMPLVQPASTADRVSTLATKQDTTAKAMTETPRLTSPAAVAKTSCS
jgi:hypothetical protein